MIQPSPDREDLRERVASLPLVEDGEILDDKAALATFEYLKQSGSMIPEHIGKVINNLSGEVGEELDTKPDHSYHVTATILRGIIARSVIRGMSQAVSDLGHAQRDINHLLRLFPNAGQLPPDSGQPPNTVA